MKLSSLLVIAILGITAAPAWGAGAWIGVNGGMSFPSGDFADVANNGFNLGGSVMVPVSPMWQLGGEIAYMNFSGDSDLEDFLSALTGENVDVSFSVLPITFAARLMVPTEGGVKPFLRGGLGAYMVGTHVDGASFSDDTSDTDLGFNLGGGILGRSGANMHIGGDLNWHYISTQDNATNLFTLRLLLEWGTGGH